MYNYRKAFRSLIVLPSQIEGETIEIKVKRIMTNKEPIKDASPMIYTERKEGVNAAYNIKTDRFELATEAMDKIHKSRLAKRDEATKKMDNVIKDVKTMKDNEVESTPGKAAEQSK